MKTISKNIANNPQCTCDWIYFQFDSGAGHCSPCDVIFTYFWIPCVLERRKLMLECVELCDKCPFFKMNFHKLQ